eukprot:245178_1
MRFNSTELRHRSVPQNVPSSTPIKPTESDTPIKKEFKSNVSKSSKKKKALLCWLIVNIIFGLFFCIIYEYGSGHNHYVPGLRTIYIVLATLGDHACPTTLNDLYKNAKYPHNIHIGIYQQNTPEDPDCLGMLTYCTDEPEIIHPELGDITTLCAMKDNILINRTTVAEGAKGCHYGRHMTMKLQEQETDFVVFVDSHSVFRKHWDAYVMKMWYTIEPNREYAVITHYPCGAENMHRRIKEKDAYSYHICGSQFGPPPNNMLKNSNGCFVGPDVTKPIRVPYWAGGFNFARSHFWKNVPLDPYVQYVFDGDEMNVATRGWTHGYDFYSPPNDIVGHYYDKGPKRRSPHVGRNQESHILRDKSEKRLNYIWGLWNIRYPQDKGLTIDEISKKCELRELSKYGLGTKRTLKQYWKFAGINPYNKTITVFKESLYAQGGLDYVPYSN